ncbi:MULTISPECIES: glutathione S-transferase family protein [Sulfitobacter]|uniref:Disulfide-bond oxidoreductase YfcG n=1 Tax=Sulfitobacter dubius TaxID=218673 RepID=A0ABY3ZHV6_9RHOB|nr:glutathione S-transferase [Sulfitobacter dubius]UOA14230.1 Disulfide-bond oxidoreductase YfcG [Sulfitobacter dubius]WOI30278.1 glutathione S-transferase [Sulfitobacter dubius]|tara:strand:- start:358 stop:981 length:624 start_codon:yes stop_codon:yes gene_type:complete
MPNAVRIHHFAKSGHAHRALVFAKLAGIPHEIVPVDLAAGAQKSPKFLAMNPNGQVPVLEDGDVVVSDSNAILVYLARAYAQDWFPSDAIGEADVQRWLTLAAGEIAFGSCAARLITVFGAQLDPDFAAAVAARALQKLEYRLTDHDWLVGDGPTIADVACYSYTAHAPEGNISLDSYPHVRAWLARFEALPGFEAMPSTAVGLVGN